MFPGIRSLRATLVACSFLAGLSSAAPSRAANRTSPVPVAPPAEWVEELEVPPAARAAADPAGFVVNFLLIQNHDHVPEQASYERRVYRIANEGGLQPGARLTWEFDPSFEQLTLHHVRVIRGDEVQDRLATASIKVIQQERDFDRHLLNGRQTAFILLDDVRVGDVIDYATTLKGWNPLLGGRYVYNSHFTFPWPVQRYRVRIDTTADRIPLQRLQGPVPAATVERNGQRVSLTWEGTGGKPVQSEPDQPSWFDPFDAVYFSEFSQWAEVVEWALPIFGAPDVIAPALSAKAAELVHGAGTDEAKALAILQFVQQEIRYLGIELGAGSLQPSPPAEVLARRFGDCKDKAVLFCTLMRAAGLTAYPALVNTRLRRMLDDRLPSPRAFNHAIVCIPSAQGRRWADPTLTSQAAGFERRGLPDYERALVVRPGETELSVIEVPAAAAPKTVVEEHFDSPAFDQPARLEVVTRCTGLAADLRRAQFATNSAEKITKDCANFYASIYPGIASTKPVTWTDDRERNTVTFVETYEIPNLWTKGDDDRLHATFDPKVITQLTGVPQRLVRTTPLAIGHPRDFTLTITARLPGDWSIKESRTVEEWSAFRAVKSIAAKGRDLTIHYEWQTTADHVPVEALAESMRKLAEFNRTIKYTLNWKEPEKKTNAKRSKR